MGMSKKKVKDSFFEAAKIYEWIVENKGRKESISGKDIKEIADTVFGNPDISSRTIVMVKKMIKNEGSINLKDKNKVKKKDGTINYKFSKDGLPTYGIDLRGVDTDEENPWILDARGKAESLVQDANGEINDKGYELQREFDPEEDDRYEDYYNEVELEIADGYYEGFTLIMNVDNPDLTELIHFATKKMEAIAKEVGLVKMSSGGWAGPVYDSPHIIKRRKLEKKRDMEDSGFAFGVVTQYGCDFDAQLYLSKEGKWVDSNQSKDIARFESKNDAKEAASKQPRKYQARIVMVSAARDSKRKVVDGSITLSRTRTDNIDEVLDYLFEEFGIESVEGAGGDTYVYFYNERTKNIILDELEAWGVLGEYKLEDNMAFLSVGGSKVKDSKIYTEAIEAEFEHVEEFMERQRDLYFACDDDDEDGIEDEIVSNILEFAKKDNILKNHVRDIEMYIDELLEESNLKRAFEKIEIELFSFYDEAYTEEEDIKSFKDFQAGVSQTVGPSREEREVQNLMRFLTETTTGYNREPFKFDGIMKYRDFEASYEITEGAESLPKTPIVVLSYVHSAMKKDDECCKDRIVPDKERLQGMYEVKVFDPQDSEDIKYLIVGLKNHSLRDSTTSAEEIKEGFKRLRSSIRNMRYPYAEATLSKGGLELNIEVEGLLGSSKNLREIEYKVNAKLEEYGILSKVNVSVDTAEDVVTVSPKDVNLKDSSRTNLPRQKQVYYSGKLESIIDPILLRRNFRKKNRRNKK